MSNICQNRWAVMVVAGLLVAGCENGSSGSGGTFPAYTDGNKNSINDYVEAGTHFVSGDDPNRHEFLDNNGDGICDLAQQTEPMWHGPGYIDTDGDGICDYWDSDSPMHHEGRRDIVHGSDFSEVEHPSGQRH